MSDAPRSATIALDARQTKQMSVGMKTYVEELVRRLPRVAPDLEFAVIDAPIANASWREQAWLPSRLRGSGAALAHFMSVYAPRWPNMPYVYTIHDLIHRRFPEYFSWKIPPYYRFVAGPVARGAAAVITDAEATIPDLERFLGIHPKDVRVVPLGVSEAFVLDDASRAERAARARRTFGVARPFFLYAGNHRPHKNLQTLAAAWHALAEECDLVITEDGPLHIDMDKTVKSNGRIVRTGRVGRDELIDLYAACAGAVQPSLFEGFGLSVLEAMSAGAPVAIAQTPTLEEVAGTAALSFPPQDPAALTAVLRTLLRDRQAANELRVRGQKRAASFTWDETARRTAAIYRECVAR